MTVARIILAACLLASCGKASPYVLDGDTFALGPERIRIMGMDAPELHPAHCARERDLGQKAKRRLVELLRTPPTLERHGRDHYGRTLAVVRVDGGDVAVTLIHEALARPYDGHQRAPWCP